MKILRLIFGTALIACALQACRHGASQITANNNSLSTTDTSATLNLGVDKDDSDFAVDAANGNAAEIAMGQLALKNGKSKQVKNFGTMMIKDHGAANAKLMALSRSKGLNLVALPGTAAQKIIDSLSGKTGDEFDKAYISTMINGHEADIKKFTDATKRVQDPDLQKYAIKTLPVLQKHLDAINAIHDSMP
jgi:putative membrane protein